MEAAAALVLCWLSLASMRAMAQLVAREPEEQIAALVQLGLAALFEPFRQQQVNPGMAPQRVVSCNSRSTEKPCDAEIRLEEKMELQNAREEGMKCVIALRGTAPDQTQHRRANIP